MNGKRKVPARLLAIADRCRGGQTLCKFLRQKTNGETEVVFFYEPSGKRCAQKSATDAIAAGLLKPSCDGLFGPESSQTYEAV